MKDGFYWRNGENCYDEYTGPVKIIDDVVYKLDGTLLHSLPIAKIYRELTDDEKIQYL